MKNKNIILAQYLFLLLFSVIIGDGHALRNSERGSPSRAEGSVPLQKGVDYSSKSGSKKSFVKKKQDDKGKKEEKTKESVQGGKKKGGPFSSIQAFLSYPVFLRGMAALGGWGIMSSIMAKKEERRDSTAAGHKQVDQSMGGYNPYMSYSRDTSSLFSMLGLPSVPDNKKSVDQHVDPWRSKVLPTPEPDQQKVDQSKGSDSGSVQSFPMLPVDDGKGFGSMMSMNLLGGLGLLAGGGYVLYTKWEDIKSFLWGPRGGQGGQKEKEDDAPPVIFSSKDVAKGEGQGKYFDPEKMGDPSDYLQELNIQKDNLYKNKFLYEKKLHASSDDGEKFLLEKDIKKYAEEIDILEKQIKINKKEIARGKKGGSKLAVTGGLESDQLLLKTETKDVVEEEISERGSGEERQEERYEEGKENVENDPDFVRGATQGSAGSKLDEKIVSLPWILSAVDGRIIQSDKDMKDLERTVKFDSFNTNEHYYNLNKMEKFDYGDITYIKRIVQEKMKEIDKITNNGTASDDDLQLLSYLDEYKEIESFMESVLHVFKYKRNSYDSQGPLITEADVRSYKNFLKTKVKGVLDLDVVGNGNEPVGVMDEHDEEIPLVGEKKKLKIQQNQPIEEMHKSTQSIRSVNFDVSDQLREEQQKKSVEGRFFFNFSSKEQEDKEIEAYNSKKKKMQGGSVKDGNIPQSKRKTTRSWLKFV